MAGQVKFGHHPYPPFFGVRHNRANVLLRVEPCIRHARLQFRSQLRVVDTFNRPSAVITGVEMQHGQFQKRHGVEKILNHGDGREPSSDVQHEASPRERRCVVHDGWFGRTVVEDLYECFQRMGCAVNGVGGQDCVVGGQDGEIVAKGGGGGELGVGVGDLDGDVVEGVGRG